MEKVLYLVPSSLDVPRALYNPYYSELPPLSKNVSAVLQLLVHTLGSPSYYCEISEGICQNLTTSHAIIKSQSSPFIIMASCSFAPLSVKVAFLVAITSARRGEMGVLTVDPSYTVSHKDKVFLRLHPKFIPKIISECHLNQDIHLPVFHPKTHATRTDRKLHSLDVH